MTILGLYHEISRLSKAAAQISREAQRPACDPRIAYDKEQQATQLANQRDDLQIHANGNEELIEKIEQQRQYLANSKFKTRYRSLAMTDLESAANWLRRENGDEEKG
jgi:hypothetical protein